MAGKYRLDTQLIHAGEPEPRVLGAVNIPIFQTAMYEYTGEADYNDLKYIRLNNTPNHRALGEKLAALENGEAAVVAGSGMAAVSTSLLAFLSSGDHMLAQRCLYGGTHDLITRDLPALGITTDFIDADDPASWAAKVRPNTRVVYVETLTNPLLELGDLDAIVAFAKSRGLVTMIDNTFASPILFRPLERGFDLSIHSATKYLNGHSDIVAGAVIGKRELVTRVRRKLNHLGGSLDPHAAYLLHRGLKTLGVRVRHQTKSALEIARALERNPKVARVSYPGLESHPRHRRARELMPEGWGGVFSFELAGGTEAARALLLRAEIPIKAPSLGGVESLLTLPARTSHAGLVPDERRALGISDGLVRMSVGLEAPEDLIADLEQALA